jgi:hypothetical protein
MISQIPEIYEEVGHYQGVSLILWYIVIVILFASAVLLLYSAMMAELNTTKMGYFAHGIFCIFYGIARLLWIFSVHNPANFLFLVSLGYVFASISLVFWVYTLEKYIVPNTKKIFTVIALILVTFSILALTMILNRYIVVFFLNVLTPVCVGFILCIYLYIIIKSEGTVRKKSIFLFIGLLFLYLAHFMDTEFFITIFPYIPLEIAPCLMIAGLAIFTYQFYLFPYFYVRSETIGD